MAAEEILLGILTMPDDTKFYFASSTYVGDVPVDDGKGGITYETTMFYGDIPEDKPIPWEKEMGFFVWGTESKMSIGDLWLFNESQSEQGDAPGRYDDLLFGEHRDSLLEYFIVDDGAAFSTATEVGKWIVDTVDNPNENHVVVSVFEKLALVDKNTEHEYYSDTLPFVSNRKQERPIMIGRGNQIPLVLIDDTNNIYEAHFEDVQNFIDAYDTADVFNPGAPDFDYTEGIQSTGGYGINLASAAKGMVTAHVNGGMWDGGSSREFESFTLYLLVTIGGMDEDDIDDTSLAAIDTEWGFKYDVFINSARNIRNILEQAMVGHCGYTYQGNDGLVKFGWVDVPAVSADHVLDEINIGDDGIRSSFDAAPGLSDGVAWRKNWHVFTPLEVKSVGITEDEKKEASSDYIYKERASSTRTSTGAFHDSYAHARHGDYIQTLVDGNTDGEDLISHLETLYAVERRHYEFERLSPSIRDALAIELGETMELNHPRFFPSGKNTLITKMSGRGMLSNIIDFRTWG